MIPTTILLTLFAANLMGYTINRVSLFALIFSIGILVDDAIVVVENIARHWAMKDGRPRLQAAIEAVAEVGNPTIVATLTVVAALLPMLFVSGLMGPYMAPIPANASAAMLFSFFVAMVVAPWLMLKLAPKRRRGGGGAWRPRRRRARPALSPRRHARSSHSRRSRLDLPARRRRRDAGCRWCCSATKSVTVKLLPFDNKSRDRGRGRSAGRRERSRTPSARCSPPPTSPAACRRSTSVQTYAGTPAPFNFNGLVRHYYLRERPELGELQVNLAARGERKRASHAIALDLRERLKARRAAGRHQHQGGRSAARTAGAGDAAGRNLRPRRRDPPRRHRAS